MQYSDKIINTFRNECSELLTSLEDKILMLEKEPGNPELVNELFRIIHSLKSESALMGFNNLSVLAHKYEDLFQQIRDGKLSVETAFLELSLKIIDKLKELLNSIITSGNDGADITELLATMGDYNRDLKQVPVDKVSIREITLTTDEIIKFSSRGMKNMFHVTISLFDNVALKYARAYMVYNDLLQDGEIIKTNVDFRDDRNDYLFSHFFSHSVDQQGRERDL